MFEVGKERYRGISTPVWLVVSGGLLLSVIGAFHLHTSEKEELRSEAVSTSRDRVRMFQHEVEDRLVRLQALRAMFVGSESVTETEFRQFVSYWHPRPDTALNFWWLPQVSSAGKENFQVRYSVPAVQAKSFGQRSDQRSAIAHFLGSHKSFDKPVAIWGDLLGRKSTQPLITIFFVIQGLRKPHYSSYGSRDCFVAFIGENKLSTLEDSTPPDCPIEVIANGPSRIYDDRGNRGTSPLQLGKHFIEGDRHQALYVDA